MTNVCENLLANFTAKVIKKVKQLHKEKAAIAFKICRMKIDLKKTKIAKKS